MNTAEIVYTPRPKIDGKNYKRWQERGYLDTRDVIYMTSYDRVSFSENVYKFYHDVEYRNDVISTMNELNKDWAENGVHPYRHFLGVIDVYDEAHKENELRDMAKEKAKSKKMA